MKLLLSILLMVIAVTASSRIKQHTITANDSAKQNIEFLTGSWTITTDFLKINIQFTIKNGNFYLIASNNYSYYFFKADSFPLSGVSMTWPPHDCTVRKLDKNTIEVQYTPFGGKPVTYCYKRANQL